MRIVHVVRQFHPSIGGLEDTVLNVANHQRTELGIDAHVVTLNRLFSDPGTMLPLEETVDHVPVRRISWVGSSRYPIAPSVLGHIRDADVVHVHGVDFFFDYLSLTRKLHRRHMVASTHGGFFHTPFMKRAKQAYFQTVTRRALSAYQAVIASSDQDAELFSGIGGERVVTVESGASIGKFANAAAQNPRRCLIYFGRLASHKRIGDLFGLLAALRRLSPEWELIVAASPGDLKWDDLIAEARRHSVSDAVQFHRAPDNDKLRDLLGQASYYASASEHEGFGVAAIEALSAGLIPVLSDIPPFRKLIAKTKCGVILRDRAYAGAADQIERLYLELIANAASMRRHLMDIASEYDWSAVARRYTDVYKRFVETAGAAA